VWVQALGGSGTSGGKRLRIGGLKGGPRVINMLFALREIGTGVASRNREEEAKVLAESLALADSTENQLVPCAGLLVIHGERSDCQTTDVAKIWVRPLPTFGSALWTSVVPR
jgi:hypothetical protein